MRLAALVLLLACQGTMPQDAITFGVTTADSVYDVGGSIDVRLTVVNDSTAPVALQFSSGQRFDLLIVSATQDTLFTWSADKGFIQMLGTEQIGPGDRLEFRDTIAPALPAGTYTLVGLLASTSHPLEARTTFRIR